jgi:hypothetical protein
MSALRSAFRSRAALLVENAVLRQQIIVLRHSVPKPRIHARDRVLLALAARVFSSGLNAIIIVRPKTVVRWHRSFWRLLWRRKSGRPVGRPPAERQRESAVHENPDESWRRFDLVPSFCGGQCVSAVKAAEPASQRAYLDRLLARDDVLAIALGEHKSDVELLLVQRLGHGGHLARADLWIGKR